MPATRLVFLLLMQTIDDALLCRLHHHGERCYVLHHGVLVHLVLPVGDFDEFGVGLLLALVEGAHASGVIGFLIWGDEEYLILVELY